MMLFMLIMRIEQYLIFISFRNIASFEGTILTIKRWGNKMKKYTITRGPGKGKVFDYFFCLGSLSQLSSLIGETVVEAIVEAIASGGEESEQLNDALKSAGQKIAALLVTAPHKIAAMVLLPEDSDEIVVTADELEERGKALQGLPADELDEVLGLFLGSGLMRRLSSLFGWHLNRFLPDQYREEFSAEESG